MTYAYNMICRLYLSLVLIPEFVELYLHILFMTWLSGIGQINLYSVTRKDSTVSKRTCYTFGFLARGFL